MKSSIVRIGRVVALSLACTVGCSVAFAEKPEWAGNGNKQEQKEKKSKFRDDRQGTEVKVGAYFGDPQRAAAREYYGKKYSAKRCPPGLAKKNNGCMPPGQAKKWNVGQRLPKDVIYYPVPQGVVVQLGIPPAGHRYVRVANDILLIAIGSSMVIDAIEDLMR
ncbi:hypothetical protein [Rhodoferax sp.]|uniref:hypothetical protein n=1 Tax=Rhodoferax sp. TaxID=50421 RepID=UPI001ECB260E|nr:hypothetical protein [Rhodoferax sp.]MBT9506263.1 hypothetical protein [Rhodoferax sp.]